MPRSADYNAARSEVCARNGAYARRRSTGMTDGGNVTQRIVADLVWCDGALRRGLAVDVDAHGVICGVGAAPVEPSPPPPVRAATERLQYAALQRPPAAVDVPTRRLAGRMLLPGFVSAHSHAFQRALRGSGETFPAGVGDFWSWREAMFALVERLTPEKFRRVCRETFEEMLAVGITTVGEFHYVHHADVERADFALDREVIAAAAEVGIRLCLLQSYYRTGHFDRPLAGGQRRFATTDVQRFVEGCDALAAALDPRTQSLGIAPHSLRAVPPEDLEALATAADERDWVVHIHVEEQRREIEDCRAALGTNPLRWMLDHLPLNDRWCIVHGTHSTADDLRAYAQTGGRHCVCPLTEGNLGDGIALLPEMLARPQAVCIGTDSNVRLDPAEELRWLEFVQRLAAERRGVVKTGDGRVGARLLEIGTRSGAAALGLNTGEIAVGRPADLVAVDIGDVSLRGGSQENLLDAYLLGSGAQAVREVCVGGRWVR